MSQSESRRGSRRIAAGSETPVPADTPVAAAEIEAPPALPDPAPAAPDLPSPEYPSAPVPPVSPMAAKAEAQPPFGPDLFAAFSDSQAAIARGVEALAEEVAILVRAGFSHATESATAMLGARTLADAVEANLGLVRKSLDTAFDGSVTVAEIGFKTASDAIHPLIWRFGEAWPPRRAA